MCTVVVSFEPGSRLPLLVLAVRDELLARPWLPPAAHWPGTPTLLGGLDLQAGGTWLAVDPAARRVACVLNGHGRPAALPDRRSRGDLPLRGAAGEPTPPDLRDYDPFHLVVGDPHGVTMVSWDGERRDERALSPGLTVIVNAGMDPSHPRAARLLRELAVTPRPNPDHDRPVGAWGPWLGISSGLGTTRERDDALIIRRVADGGALYGSSSVSLLAASVERVRYDFAPVPDEPEPLRPTRVA